jgi:PIN domain nuclease of toxin-antitoxin system
LKILLDTQALILAGRNELPKPAATAYTLKSNQIYFSLVSLWEIGIKTALGKLRFKHKITDYHSLLETKLGILPLSIETIHIETAVSLPFYHKDPFDRLIIGQALTEDFVILGSDAYFDSYGCRRIWD